MTLIAFPDAPRMPDGWSDEALRIVDTLVAAVRALPGARPDRVALFRHSRGDRAALHYVIGGVDVRETILNSAAYPAKLADPRRSAEDAPPAAARHG